MCFFDLYYVSCEFLLFICMVIGGSGYIYYFVFNDNVIGYYW